MEAAEVISLIAVLISIPSALVAMMDIFERNKQRNEEEKKNANSAFMQNIILLLIYLGSKKEELYFENTPFAK